MQKHVNLVDLVKCFPTHILLQKLASIQKRTSPVKFAHLAEKSGKGSISNLSTKARTRLLALRCPPVRMTRAAYVHPNSIRTLSALGKLSESHSPGVACGVDTGSGSKPNFAIEYSLQ